MSVTRWSLRLVVLFCAAAAATPAGQRQALDAPGGHVINGRVDSV
jgi:hypothetical protein